MTASDPAALLPPEHEGRFLIWRVLGGAVAIPLVLDLTLYLCLYS